MCQITAEAIHGCPDGPFLYFFEGFGFRCRLYSAGYRQRQMEIFGIQLIAVGQNDGLFYAVLQLPDISAPMIGKQNLSGGICQPGNRTMILLA